VSSGHRATGRPKRPATIEARRIFRDVLTAARARRTEKARADMAAIDERKPVELDALLPVPHDENPAEGSPQAAVFAVRG
jgi:hypothetical protein